MKSLKKNVSIHSDLGLKVEKLRKFDKYIGLPFEEEKIIAADGSIIIIHHRPDC
jgi:hypothetical protein